MTPFDILLGFRVVLLQRNSKDPIARNGHHWVTTDPEVIRRHDGNFGIMTGGRHAVIDFDDVKAMAGMVDEFGPLQPTVETGSGKFHCYVVHVPGLPRYYYWHGKKIGEIARLPTEYTVAPPSIHPITKQPYKWLVDPRGPMPPLTQAWHTFLLSQVAPPSPNPDGTWTGPAAEELVRLAMRQPGARPRSYGVKFQCPGCRAEKHDAHMDNAIVFLDGRWGCAVNSGHGRAIGEALGIAFGPPLIEVEGYDPRMLRRLGMRL
jgi:hypothetical protein